MQELKSRCINEEKVSVIVENNVSRYTFFTKSIFKFQRKKIEDVIVHGGFGNNYLQMQEIQVEDTLVLGKVSAKMLYQVMKMRFYMRKHLQCIKRENEDTYK